MGQCHEDQGDVDMEQRDRPVIATWDSVMATRNGDMEQCDRPVTATWDSVMKTRDGHGTTWGRPA